MRTTLFISCLFSIVMMYAQGSNELYGNNQKYNSTGYQLNNGEYQRVFQNKNEAVYRIKILNNVKTDAYMVTFGLNQEASTVKECNAKINQRIDGFKSVAKKLGIKEDEIYIDFITQNKIYDYESETQGSQIKVNQVDAGFEIKKNVILRFSNQISFDDLVEKASDFDIHNIIKIDYVNLNADKIYDQMFEEAQKLVQIRKNQMSKHIDEGAEDVPTIQVSFAVISPTSQYKSFQAFETSELSYSNNSRYSDKHVLRQEERKSKTFYYDGLNPQGYDKIMNANMPFVGMQYVMEVTMTYRKKQ